MTYLDNFLSAMHIQNFLAASQRYLALDNNRGTATQQLSASSMRIERDRLSPNAYRKMAQSLFLAAGLGAFAAGPVMADPGCGPMGQNHEHHAKMLEQHHKQLHDALKLTPEQEPAWNTLMSTEQQKRVTAGARTEDWSKLKAPERADKMLEFAKARQEQMSEHVAALKAFYATLTPEQQQIFEDHHAAPRRGMRGMSAPKTPGAGKADAKP